MTPKEKMDIFWATGILPGTMFDDLNDRVIQGPMLPRPRRRNWLRLLSLGLLG